MRRDSYTKLAISQKVGMKEKRLLLYTALVVVLALVPIGTMHILWPHFLWQSEPLHSTVEAVGALAAILMAIVLLQRQSDESGRRLFWVAMGLLGAGILDVFHAASQPGQGFVLLHSTAVLVSSFGFALVWLPESDRYASMRKWILLAVIIGSTLFGIWALSSRGTLPVMVQDGEFTTTARVLNLLSGAFFIAAAGRFLVDFHRSLRSEPYLFSCMALLFGMASLTFTYSALWDDAWWFWHLVRLSAYLLVMTFVIHGYRQTALSLRHEITERKRAEEGITHLTAVLRAIRNVNQLITREKEGESLIQKSCDLLVQRKGYERAWILLLDETRNFVMAASTGLGEKAPAFLKQLEAGDYPVCIRELLTQEQAFSACDQPGKQHQGCVLADEHSRQGVFRCKLEYGGKLYGVLGVALPSGAVSDKEEQSLFLELCGDIAFALANIEREEKRRQAEEALRMSEERYRTLVDNALVGVFRSNLKGDVLYVNNAIVSMFSFDSAEEMIAGGVLVRYKNPNDRANLIKELTEKGKVNNLELALLTKTGETKNAIINAVLEGDTLSGMLIDITERKRAEEEIARFNAVSDLATYGITILDSQHLITYVNKTCAQLHGYTGNELIGKHCTILIPEDYTEIVDSLLARSGITGGFANEEVPHKRKNGTTFPALMTGMTVKDDSGQPLYTAVIVIDITERKKLEAQMMVTDRLASIGELASGIAHELNNPLTGVIGFSDLLLQRDLPDDIREDLNVINREAKRTAQVVRNLLTFARKHPQEKQAVNINDAIQLVLELRSYEQKLNNIQVNTYLAPDLTEVMADGFRLQQVFLNIIINAEYFMIEAHRGGTLTITTERIGDITRISLADDGPGIARENLGHIFDPFFTTKEVGKGTGLGLSICHGIITEHGGRIYAESEPGKGATFIVELPISP